ncbi:MAG TPA: carboxypeptidase-like regulatory domain-containing protein [Terracidiphilus sp.]|jgi:hypothetical protein|nr:carboxypeptidase-like regulatory domain-containing protein [Terracidiphilus sp.]
MKIIACIVLAALSSPALLAQTPAPAAPDNCVVHGRVADPLGAAISRAFFLVHSDGWATVDQQVKLSDNGEFDLRLKPGLYDLFIASPGFVPQARIIDTRACKPITLKLKMLVDMEHLED